MCVRVIRESVAWPQRPAGGPGPVCNDGNARVLSTPGALYVFDIVLDSAKWCTQPGLSMLLNSMGVVLHPLVHLLYQGFWVLLVSLGCCLYYFSYVCSRMWGFALFVLLGGGCMCLSFACTAADGIL
jgi:hypothetical protein